MIEDISEEQLLDWMDKGVLFTCSGGGTDRYNKNRCPFTSLACKKSCKLYKDGSCAYADSLTRTNDVHRKIDNKILFKTETPLVHSAKETLPKGDVKKEDALHSSSLVVGTSRGSRVASQTPFCSTIKKEKEINEINNEIDSW